MTLPECQPLLDTDSKEQRQAKIHEMESLRTKGEEWGVIADQKTKLLMFECDQCSYTNKRLTLLRQHVSKLAQKGFHVQKAVS